MFPQTRQKQRILHPKGEVTLGPGRLIRFHAEEEPIPGLTSILVLANGTPLKREPDPGFGARGYSVRVRVTTVSKDGEALAEIVGNANPAIHVSG